VTALAGTETVRSWPLEFDVSRAVPFEDARLGGWVCAPVDLDSNQAVVVLACLAGGTCSTGYWDAAAEGVPDSSMARYLATRGFAVFAFDHLGIGASSAVDDIFTVTPTVAAAAQDAALRQALDQLRAGALVDMLPPLSHLVTVGVGHSMGGMIVGVQQARHRTFDAIAVLGHGGDGLPGVLTPEEHAIVVEDRPFADIEADVVACARVRFAPDTTVERKRPVPGSFLLPDVPPALRDAFVAQQTPLIFSSGLTSMIPGATNECKATIDVPVFLAFGDHDLTANYAGNLARYTATHDATLYVVHDSAHCHNHATTRTRLWDRLATWATGLTV
jgi:pimeloyl-ACP methyl ester carboxylesterase